MLDIYIPSTAEHAHLRIRKRGSKFEITKNLKSVLYTWLSEYKDYNDDIAYQGSYIGFIQQLYDFGYETAWSPDHSDWYSAAKLLNSNYINDSF
jgi:deoxyadenosine/deoxycytidine kinase